MTAPPDTKLRLRDMLMPAGLLERSGASENPLVRYSQRRSRHWNRWLLARLMELMLLAMAGLLLFGENYFLGSIPFELEQMTLGIVLGFLLLRYHLLRYDQTRHIRTLSRDRLVELLLTRLDNSDFFLHHFLLLCLHYQVPAVFSLLFAMHTSYMIFSNDYRWVSFSFYQPYFHLSCVIMLAWVLSLQQYIIEWKWYAGGRVTNFQTLLGWLHSAWWAIVIGLLSSLIVWPLSGSLALPLLGILFGAFAIGCWSDGRKIHSQATEILWQRIRTDDAPSRHAGLADLLLPWCWPKATATERLELRTQAQAILPSQARLDLMIVLPLALGLAAWTSLARDTLFRSIDLGLIQAVDLLFLLPLALGMQSGMRVSRLHEAGHIMTRRGYLLRFARPIWWLATILALITLATSVSMMFGHVWRSQTDWQMASFWLAPAFVNSFLSAVLCWCLGALIACMILRPVVAPWSALARKLPFLVFLLVILVLIGLETSPQIFGSRFWDSLLLNPILLLVPIAPLITIRLLARSPLHFIKLCAGVLAAALTLWVIFALYWLLSFPLFMVPFLLICCAILWSTLGSMFDTASEAAHKSPNPPPGATTDDPDAPEP